MKRLINSNIFLAQNKLIFFALTLFLILLTILPVSAACSNPNVSFPPLPNNISGQQSLVSVFPDFVSVLKSIIPCVVAIDTEKKTVDLFNNPILEEVAGSGWVYESDSSHSYIVTNDHVVSGSSKILITLTDGKTTYEATIVGTDPLTDLAVLKVNRPNLNKLKLADSSIFKVGQWVLSIGNSLGMGITAKEGIISRLEVDLQTATDIAYNDLLETSAIINQGNSGGPLINLAGEIVGITSFKLSQLGVEGMGYAINIEDALPIIDQLVKAGKVKRPWAGIVGTNIDSSISQTFGISVSSGIFVSGVSADSPADKAGIKEGDVIVGVNGTDIMSSDQFDDVIQSSQVGTAISITCYRNNSKYTCELKLAQNPAK
jgi:serine protease Do